MYDEGIKWTPPDARSLPPHFIPPLRQASAILARQSQHVTLVVLRRDYQIMPQEQVSKSPLSILERLTRPRSTTKPRDAGTYGIRLMHLTGLQPIESERLHDALIKVQREHDMS
ncbi:hypothetical protein GMORB2_6781 [Geosmithia morbida]|uniref:Uncharacterized protein n=1 Tax=Geosmithia morbida TaxID=1094350 RepID=A0A9P4YUB2_9HYPO|nr:uncharacterized protein GMORB2_6781 [Geosmithia morbida]KAF4123231.1 hypothetical protein GMORB2_6781 [Geosmithia morbida]